jgi:tRNA-specific 2-thiouridylase
MADQRHLPYLKKESQEICFTEDIYGFLKTRIHTDKGPIIDFKTRKKIGEHKGIQFYTIGQRVPVGGTGPYYVFFKNLKKNQLIVVGKGDKNSFYKKITLKNVNWISGQPPKSAKILVRTRYRQPLIKAELVTSNKQQVTKENKKSLVASYCLLFTKPIKFVAPGQSAVFYNKESELLGGGVII